MSRLIRPDLGSASPGRKPWTSEVRKFSINVLMHRATEVKLDTSWMGEGRCRELPPEVFFPSDGVGVEVARRYCAECPVKSPCLEYALENHIEHGVWGGCSERERRRIARSRRGLPPRTPVSQAQATNTTRVSH
ncbi:MAG TPA: WhiB family transcriptional regulator [Acidimicrobiales bacterium]|jgi:WhiB family transcriptional regulator, redox-sensing transcriptional regulator|nr:WhiB family transcriptional regulator [Acidimicrobiales bacterium]